MPDLIIDEITPTRIAAVTSEAELVDLLTAANASADRDEAVVVPIGGGTSLGIGNVPPRVDLAVDLRGLAGIENYVPGDLTLTARAGTRLADLQAELAAHGQELPIDMPLAADATIGGLAATAFAGPRRYGAGTLKDALIGSSFVRGDGLLAKAGGIVVKNVSGFEMSRFLHGSWGSLAVITSVNLKVTPIPKADRTLAFTFATLAEAVVAFRMLVDGGIRPVSAEIVSTDEASQLIIRIQGRVASVAEQGDHVLGLALPTPDVDVSADESVAFWRALTDRWAVDRGGVQIAIGVRPRDVLSAAASLGRREVRVDELLVSPGTGSIRGRVAVETLAPTELWQWLLGVTTLPHGSAFVEFSPVDWKRHVDVWGARPESLPLMQAIKAQFDPVGLLNRGRMVV